LLGPPREPDPIRSAHSAIIEWMMAEAVRRNLAALREPARARRIARALWITWAIVVWNVVFDRVIVVAGRRYVRAATAAARGGGPFARVDDWMRPAVTRGLWTATAAGAAVLVIGLLAVRFSVDKDSPVSGQ
jgi:hypothetical protein